MTKAKPIYSFFCEKSGWKEGDKVKCLLAGDGIGSKYEVGKVYTLDSDLNLKGFRLNGYSAKFELVVKLPEVQYEDQWHLNDGTKEIPEDADKLEKDGSVVAYRLVKKPKVDVLEENYGISKGGGLVPLYMSHKYEIKLTSTWTDGELTDIKAEKV